MRRTEYFLPTLKEDPKEAEIASHRLMLRTGMIRQEAAGIYSWLPLGLKVLYKIEQIVREEQNRSGAFEIMMPTIQPASLWKKSGRYDAYGKEMLRITDRHNREMLFSPTNEEMLTDIFATYVNSYKDLPKNLYQIHWKFRDEVRPRFGVMRGREFFMKDNYSFDLDEDAARISYMKMFYAYMRTFNRMGVNAIPMKADTGPIGGDLSHEFILLAKTGESGVFVDKKWMDIKDDAVTEIDPKDIDGITQYFEKYSSIYAATDEIHDADNCPNDLVESRGVEVGHIFYFGTKYSEPMGAKVATKDGSNQAVHMGSYGIGVSRLVGAMIEASHDENGIIWPEEVAPFDVGLINLRVGDTECDTVCEDIYRQLSAIDKDILYDDRDVGAGFKFNDMDLIGIPWCVTIGPRGMKSGMAELKNRATGEKFEVAIDQVIDFFKKKKRKA